MVVFWHLHDVIFDIEVVDGLSETVDDRVFKTLVLDVLFKIAVVLVLIVDGFVINIEQFDPLHPDWHVQKPETGSQETGFKQLHSKEQFRP